MATFETGSETRSESIEDLKSRLSDLANQGAPTKVIDDVRTQLQNQTFESVRRKTILEMILEEELGEYFGGRFGTVPDAAKYATNRLVSGYELNQFENRLLTWKKLYGNEKNRN